MAYLAIVLASCAGTKPLDSSTAAAVPLSLFAERQMIIVPAGPFRRGSTEAERQTAYDDYKRTAGHDGARRGSWFEREPEATQAFLPAYRIDRTPVTQGAYAEFIAHTNRPAPTMDVDTWKSYGFIQDYESEVRRFQWHNRRPPAGREDHPVVLVTWKEANAYCTWRGKLTGHLRRLPSADEFEKAARGPNGAIYPWGNDYDPNRLNSADRGDRDTTPVGSYPSGSSKVGAQNVAGNVFQWTKTPWSKGRMTVKGSAWDDHGGLGRAAAAHGRRTYIRHVIVGFRCAGPA